MTVTGDESLLRIMLHNLLDNAWKYTSRQDSAAIQFVREDEADPRAPEHERNRPIFCVRDNGIGFDNAYADKLFGAFQRLHTEKDFPGLGIGLATVQRIAHRHGGRIWAASEPGKGARFYFTLG
jgi:signal transduction histidine kinase